MTTVLAPGWPTLELPPLTVLSSISPTSWAQAMAATGASMAMTSTTWSASNRALYVPVYASRPVTAAKLFWYNSGAVSGNADCGVYSEDGRRLVSTGSTAQVNVFSPQMVDITDTVVGPGVLYLALAFDNTTAQHYMVDVNTTGPVLQCLGLALQETAFPLPVTATFATMTVQYVPICGLTEATVV